MKWKPGMTAKVIATARKLHYGAWAFPPVGAKVILGEKHCGGGHDYECFYVINHTTKFGGPGFVHTYALAPATAPTILSFSPEDFQ